MLPKLNNPLSNAARPAPASSPIRVGAAREGGHVASSVSDEGARDSARPAPSPLPQARRRGHRYRPQARHLQRTRRGARSDASAPSAGMGRGARFTSTIPVAGEAALGEQAPPARREGGGDFPGRRRSADARRPHSRREARSRPPRPDASRQPAGSSFMPRVPELSDLPVRLHPATGATRPSPNLVMLLTGLVGDADPENKPLRQHARSARKMKTCTKACPSNGRFPRR